MPSLKTETISARNGAGSSTTVKVGIKMSVDGDFYCKAPDE